LAQEQKKMSFDKARALIQEFKGNAYQCGFGVLSEAGKAASGLGKRAAVVRDSFPGGDQFVETIVGSLKAAGVGVLTVIEGAGPNAPREDVFRIADKVKAAAPDVLVGFGGGSTLDAVKAAEVLRTLGGSIDDYFGTGLVTAALEKSGKKLTPIVAIQTASSSASHLTKYSNITDLKAGQKKLIVDMAVAPPRAIYDYGVSLTSPHSLTVDGALDGVAHCLEVLFGAVGQGHYERMTAVAEEGIRLVMQHLPRVVENPGDREGREALALATDLGGYSIMLGGTNGAHLTSFSLIDILSHGRACAVMNPYYTVFFSPAVQEPLRLVARICREAGYGEANLEKRQGRELAEGVARALIEFEKKVGCPATLGEVRGFSDAHIERALTAAKNPQLKMKLENMPVPLTADRVDEYMGSVLQAAKTGDLSLVRNVA
jgi:alcohol dehydrogenase class IV